MGLTGFVSKAIGEHCTHIGKLVSSVSDTLKLEFHANMEVPHTTERNDTTSEINFDYL